MWLSAMLMSHGIISSTVTMVFKYEKKFQHSQTLRLNARFDVGS